MKLTKITKPSPTGAAVKTLEPVARAGSHDKAERLEERLTRLAEEVAELEVRSKNFGTQTDEVIRRRAQTFLDLLDRRIEEIKADIIYNVIDFLEAAPFWDILKIDEKEHHRSDASARFSKALREGWRYVGSYRNPKASVPAERYTLFIRPKGRPLVASEYLKFYEEFVERRDAETARLIKQSKLPTTEQVVAELRDAKKTERTPRNADELIVHLNMTKKTTPASSKVMLKIKPKGK